MQFFFTINVAAMYNEVSLFYTLQVLYLALLHNSDELFSASVKIWSEMLQPKFYSLHWK